ncbi:MAG: hypothetical protein IJ371_06440 [Clostridia bacterium]|nr:hypothetical protein [Clostridia bacterium]
MENNTDTQVVDNVVQEETTKTYTKEDLDNSFNAGVKKASTEWQKDEKYKEFLAWKKTSQSDSEKMAELQTNFNNVSNENKYLKAQLEVSNSDVKKEFSKFVTSEVMNNVNDTTDFATALKDYKNNNPQYFGETVVKKVQTSPGLNNGGNQPQTTNNIMNDILRGARK